MPFRDDDDARLARADALQVDLEQERDEHARDKERDQARIAELEAKLAAAPAPPKPAPAPALDAGGSITHTLRDNSKEYQRASRDYERSGRGKPLTIGTAIGVGVLVIAIVIYQYLTSRPDRGSQRHFAVADLTTAAWQHAKAWAPDAEVQYVYIGYTSASGDGYLDRGFSGFTMLFRSPAQLDVDQCRFLANTKDEHTDQVDYTSNEEPIHEWDDHNPQEHCGHSEPGPLHCNVPQLWKLAIADGADPKALATVELTTTVRGRNWEFAIYRTDGQGKVRRTWSRRYPDRACL